MPYVTIGSPFLPGALDIYYRDLGHGAPLVILHGGWGYEFYPFDDAIARLPHRFVIPDRTGYGRSPAIAELPPHFHDAAAIETEAVLDALAIDRCALWGHSDGAIIAALLAIHNPRRYAGIIVEAMHFDREKPRSRAFFEMMANDPDGFGDRVTAKLASEHGPAWRTIIRAGGRAWLDIAATPDDDLYHRRLHELAVPVLVLHGADDPRTEPNELDRIRRDVPSAEIHVLPGGGHSPHSERATAATCTELAGGFLGRLF